MKEYFIERRQRLLKIVSKKDKELHEIFFEEQNKEPQPGEIYKGIVKNIVPAIKCAFIDIGFDKHCFMYLDKKFNNLNVKKNDEIIVEVLKEATGDKGPKVINAFTIPGRYAVLETLNLSISYSKKIINPQFKRDAEMFLKRPKDVGIMIRTNAEKVGLEVIQSEIEHLYSIYKNLLREESYSIKPKLLYRGEGILDKVLRDSIDEITSKIFVDSEKDFTYIKDFLSYNKYLNIELILHKEPKTLFNFYGLERLILAVKSNKLNLASGGSIVIDKTEGMYVIDVNSGSNVKGKDLRTTAYSTNIEAARLIPKQILLRNLGGIIIVDFIDMDEHENKSKVLEILKEGFKDDKNKTTVFQFTELNLVQIARNRKGKPIMNYIEESCEVCSGSGKKLSFTYLKHLIENEIMSISCELNIKDIYIEVDAYYKEAILKNVDSFAAEIGGDSSKLYVKFSDKLHNYKVEPLIFPNVIEKMQKLKIYG